MGKRSSGSRGKDAVWYGEKKRKGKRQERSTRAQLERPHPPQARLGLYDCWVCVGSGTRDFRQSVEHVLYYRSHSDGVGCLYYIDQPISQPESDLTEHIYTSTHVCTSHVAKTQTSSDLVLGMPSPVKGRPGEANNSGQRRGQEQGVSSQSRASSWQPRMMVDAGYT
jgi:hypothetical protein